MTSYSHQNIPFPFMKLNSSKFTGLGNDLVLSTNTKYLHKIWKTVILEQESSSSLKLDVPNLGYWIHTNYLHFAITVLPTDITSIVIVEIVIRLCFKIRVAPSGALFSSPSNLQQVQVEIHWWFFMMTTLWTKKKLTDASSLNLLGTGSQFFGVLEISYFESV